MATLVIQHVSLGAEAFAAVLRAGKRPLIVVDPIVDFQVLLLAERLVAVEKFALKGLSAVVEMLVGVQAHLAAKLFATAFEGAGEDLIARELGVHLAILRVSVKLAICHTFS